MMIKKPTNTYANEPITKARTIEEMAEIYHVSVETFDAQIKGYEALWTQLLKSNFMGKIFFPKQQQTVFRYLGDIAKSSKPENTENNKLTGSE